MRRNKYCSSIAKLRCAAQILPLIFPRILFGAIHICPLQGHELLLLLILKTRSEALFRRSFQPLIRITNAN